MRVEHRARAALFHDADMQQALVGRFGVVTAHESCILIDRKHLLRREFTFVDSAWTHRKSQRLALDHCTQISARPQQPAARVKLLAIDARLEESSSKFSDMRLVVVKARAGEPCREVCRGDRSYR